MAINFSKQKSVARKVTFYTPNKTYSGFVDLKTNNIRTLDLLNSSSIYWKNPDEKSLNQSILINKAQIELDGGKPLGGFQRLQMSLSEIIFFTDHLHNTGDISEKIRNTTLALKNNEKSSKVHILTRVSGDAFYMISGTFTGLFKKKSQERYLPIKNATVHTVVRIGEEWVKRLVVEKQFVGIATDHIESCTFH